MIRTGTKTIRAAMVLALTLGLGACATVDTATRNAQATAPLAEPAEAAPAPIVRVSEIRVSVPRALKVSEANRYYPAGDIVWREDPIGDRHQQVADIVYAGLSQGVAGLDGDVPVILDVEVTRFHALTEKARYTIGGVHAIQFNMRLLDAETGEVLIAPHKIKADFDALGGNAAVRAEARGITQKVRITQHLAKVIRDELRNPEGYLAQNTGLIGAINQL